MRRADKSCDLLVAVDVGRGSVIPIGEQIRWRNLVAWLHYACILGESTHHCEAIGPLGRLCTTRLGSPLQSELGRDEGALALRDERDETLEQTPG